MKTASPFLCPSGLPLPGPAAHTWLLVAAWLPVSGLCRKMHAWALPGLWLLLAGLMVFSPAQAQAQDAVTHLRDFAREMQTGKALFTQTVTSPDGKRRKQSRGSFEFSRPNRFRFDYTHPYSQTIVADGKEVWFFDPDLNQVSVRPLEQALGSTPASILAGTDLEKDFTLSRLPDRDGLNWVQATPRHKDSSLQWVRIGFHNKALAAIDITDAFGTVSALRFEPMQSPVSFKPDRFSFTPPAGADVLRP
jgi:outer membrane lipoprotein carrier protein